MSNRHKWADCIIAWAEGKEIQWRYIKGAVRPWYDFTNNGNAEFNNCGIEWRVKPHKYQYLMDAYKEGKTIQYKGREEWVDIKLSDLHIFKDNYEYRIKPHKYQDVIDAYVRGETVQYYCISPDWNSGWLDVVKGKSIDVFDSGHEYRIKPKPDIRVNMWKRDKENLFQITFVFDGETKAFKTMEYHDG